MIYSSTPEPFICNFVTCNLWYPYNSFSPKFRVLSPVLHDDVVIQINNLKCNESNNPYDIPSFIRHNDKEYHICLAGLSYSRTSNGVFPDKFN